MAKNNTTRQQIARAAMRLFLEKGYTATSPKMICQALDISTGTMTYYFPTKEHLLTVLVECLYQFQEKWCLENLTESGLTPKELGLELAVMMAICGADPVVRDLYTAVYYSPMSLEIIRKKDGQRAKQVYADYCADWDDDQFAAVEEMVSGIEFSSLMISADPLPERTRIDAALRGILMLYGVPKEKRDEIVTQVLAEDYLALAQRMLAQFHKFALEDSENLLDAILPPPPKIEKNR